ncbi:MAG: hypothetical protein M3326_13290, partial [Actinomycetota bacterium]|nr:hypothetical protein [Actinomycetota bacterium]
MRSPAPEQAGGELAHLVAWAGQRSRLLIALMCATVVVLGLGYSLHLGSAMAFQDERDYVRIADNLAQKGMFSLDGVHPTAARPPGWPLTLAPLRMIGLPIPALRMVNVVLLAACLFLLYLILERAWSPIVGLVGAAAGILYGLFFYTAETLYPQMLEAALVLGLVYLLFG